MIEVVAVVGPPLSAQPAVASGSNAALEQPTGAQAADFARAAASHPIAEMPAAPPVATDALSSRLAHQANDLSEHLKGLGPAPGGHEPPPSQATGAQAGTPPASPAVDQAKAQASEAVSQMERAYMFAIETTMASRGSTEATKIFNTLLKGQ